jgi:hypothetical protein
MKTNRTKFIAAPSFDLGTFGFHHVTIMGPSGSPWNYGPAALPLSYAATLHEFLLHFVLIGSIRTCR